jgi:hypothetical protein
MKYVHILYKSCLIGFALLLFGCKVQQNTITTSRNVSIHKIDYQGSIYHVHNDVIDKYDRENNLLFTYSNKSLGAITTIDVSNPLRPLIFYKDLQQIVITDNTLSIHNSQSINLDVLGMYQVQMIASSKMDNGIWFYDQETFQLTKLTPTFEVIYQSGNLTQLLGKENITPIMMIENNGFLFLVCPNNGILIFDMYGAYYKTIPVYNVDFIYPSDQFIYLVNANQVEAFHLKSIESAVIKLNQSISSIFGFYDNRFYGFVNEEIQSSDFSIEK